MNRKTQNRVNCVHALRRIKSRIQGLVYLGTVADEAREKLKAIDEDREKNKVNVEVKVDEEIER